MNVPLTKQMVLVLTWSGLAMAAAGGDVLFEEGSETGQVRTLAGRGAHCTGSTQTETVHSGLRALRLEYQTDVSGYFGWGLRQGGLLPGRAAQLRLSLWLHGDGQAHVTRATFHLVDAKGEVFQYVAYAGTIDWHGWRNVECDLFVARPLKTWGNAANGKVDFPVRFSHFSFDLPRPKGKVAGAICVDSVKLLRIREWQAEEPIACSQGRAVSASINREYHLFRPGEAVRVKFEIRPPGAQLWWRLDDWQAPVDAGRVTDGRTAHELAFRPKKRGAYALSFAALAPEDVKRHKLTDPCEALYGRRIHFAVMAPEPGRMAKAGRFRFGVHAHLDRFGPAVRRRAMDLLPQLGVDFARVDLYWQRIERKQGQFHWEPYDSFYRDLSESGVQPVPILAYSAPWASTYAGPQPGSRRDVSVSPPKLKPYLHYVRSAVERYRARTDTWEIWNEQSSRHFWRDTPEAFAELFRAAARTIKQVQPRARVMPGGWTNPHYASTFIPTFLRLAGRDADVYAYHSHGDFQRMLGHWRGHQRWYTDGGLSAAIWLNESGFSSFDGFSERDQAVEVVKKVVYAFALGHEAFVLYNYIDKGTDPNKLDHRTGILRRDLTPKALFLAYATTIRTLRGMEPGGHLRLTPGREAAPIFLVRGLGRERTVVVLWREGPPGGRVELRCSATATVRDLMGNERAVSPAKGAIVVAPVSPDPILIDIPESDVPLPAKAASARLE